jgi:hypothetical protein
VAAKKFFPKGKIRAPKQSAEPRLEASAKPAVAATLPIAPAGGPSASPAWAAFYLTVALAVIWVILDAFLTDAITVRHCENADRGIPVEQRMPLYLSEIAFDGYVWNRHAEKLGENGRWRLRWTDFDNMPNGREVHWNSAFAWYLRGLGEAYRANTGDSLRNSIYRMSIWANPILLVIALGVFSTLSARRFGPLCGTVLAVGMVAVPTFYEGFLPAYPDHHGIISFALLGLVFGIAWAGAGWVRRAGDPDFAAPDTLEKARHGMIFSAVCGAAGVWFSALSTSILLGAIGVGALVMAFFMRRQPRGAGCEFHPELWKLWAKWGSGTALVFYLLEYFPNHLSMRMEVNHPLYALAWLGGGWLIGILSGWILAEKSAPNPFPWRKLIAPLLACSVLPAVIIFGGPEVYIPKDPFMAGLWKNISELLSLAKRVKFTGLTWQAAIGWYPAFVVGAGVLLALRAVGQGTKAVLVSLAVPIILVTGLQFYQTRWGLLLGPIYIALAAIVIPQAWRILPPRRWPRLAGAVLLLGVAWLFIQPSASGRIAYNWNQYRTGQTMITQGQALALLHRQMARAIRDSAGGKPVVLLSSPNSSCILSAMGGFRTVGTLYWENVDGLKAAAKALNAQGDEEAVKLLHDLGITHVSLMSWENFIEPYFNILHPAPVEGKTVMNSFAKRALFDRVIPVWTRPLIFPPNNLTQGLKQQVLMLQLVPGQSLAEAKYHLARFIRGVEGKPDQAETLFKEILKDSPESSLVRVELCDLYISRKQFREGLDQLLAALPEADPATRENLAAQVSGALGAAGEKKLQAELLRAVAAFENANAISLLNAAWTLSTLPDAALRDGPFALAACDRAGKQQHDPAALLLVRAAALAATGDFEKAAAAAGDPILTGSANGEFRAKAAAMLDAFKAGKAWTQ